MSFFWSSAEPMDSEPEATHRLECECEVCIPGPTEEEEFAAWERREEQYSSFDRLADHYDRDHPQTEPVEEA